MIREFRQKAIMEIQSAWQNWRSLSLVLKLMHPGSKRSNSSCNWCITLLWERGWRAVAYSRWSLGFVFSLFIGFWMKLLWAYYWWGLLCLYSGHRSQLKHCLWGFSHTLWSLEHTWWNHFASRVLALSVAWPHTSPALTNIVPSLRNIEFWFQSWQLPRLSQQGSLFCDSHQF